LKLGLAESSRRLYDKGRDADPAFLRSSLGLMGICMLGEVLCSGTAAYLEQTVGMRVDFGLMSELHHSLTRLPYDFFDKPHFSHQTFFHNASKVKTFVVEHAVRMVSLPVSILLGIAYLRSFHPLLVIFALLVGPLQALAGELYKRQRLRVNRHKTQFLQSVARVRNESLTGIFAVKVCGLEQCIEQAMDSSMKNTVQLADHHAKLVRVRKGRKKKKRKERERERVRQTERDRDRERQKERERRLMAPSPSSFLLCFLAYVLLFRHVFLSKYFLSFFSFFFPCLCFLAFLAGPSVAPVCHVHSG